MCVQLHCWSSESHFLRRSNIPSLFSLFCHDLPVPTNQAVKIYTYADDLTFTSKWNGNSNAELSQAVGGVTQHQPYVSKRSSLTVAKPFNKKCRLAPTLPLMDQSIPVNADKTIFGIIIDPNWTFCYHTQVISARYKCRLIEMKVLSSTSFRLSKESLKNNLCVNFSFMSAQPGIQTFLSLTCRCSRECKTLHCVCPLAAPGQLIWATCTLRKKSFPWRSAWILDARRYFSGVTPEH